jgi:hypothetical protein
VTEESPEAFERDAGQSHEARGHSREARERDIEHFRAERGRLLEEGDRVRAEAFALEDADEFDAARPLWRRRDQITRRYKDLLPEIPVARCPSTGAVIRWPIDTVDLTGWFWDYDAPLRRVVPVPPTWRAMTGAVRLAEPVETAPFLCSPGPGVPFVVTRIIESPDIQAVISQVSIGRHIGWPITYFGPSPHGVSLVDLWGTRSYPTFDDEGTWTGLAQAIPKVEDYDFDLEPWLRSGQLLWIEPDDESATLRDTVEGCPYLGLDGIRRLQYIQDGKVWYSRE